MAAGREALSVFAVSALLTALIVGIGQIVPVVGENALALVALVFVYLPVVALRRKGLDPADFGLSSRGLRRGGRLGILVTALTLPPFLLGFHLWERMAFDHRPEVDLDNYFAFPERLLATPDDIHAPGLYVWRQRRDLHLRWVGEGPWTIELATPCRLTQRSGPPLREVSTDDDGATRWRVETDGGEHELVLWARGGDEVRIEAWRAGQPLDATAMWQGGDFGDPDEPRTLVLSRTPWWIPLSVLVQVLLVAFPEEFFYRGYLQTRLAERWPRRWQLGPVHTSAAILLTSACFALGHFIVGFDPQRLAVFFPALAFGWLRDRSGGLGASIIYHAACNLMVELTVVHYWPS